MPLPGPAENPGMSVESDATRPIRVLVVDDQTLVREGLVALIGLLPGMEVVGTAGDGAEALERAAEVAPDVVLMDLRMPRVDGVEATRSIRERHPGVQVVVLTTYSDDESVLSALRAGARGFLTKDATAQEIARAVTAVHRGDPGLDAIAQEKLLRALDSGGRPARRERAAPALPDGLSPREAEVLALIAAGSTNAEIAEELCVTEATVKTHINNIFSKAHLRDRAAAVLYAHRHGLAPGDEP